MQTPMRTKTGLFPPPLSPEGAMDRVDAWLASPGAVVVEPSVDHASVLRRLLQAVGSGGNLVNDAHLAALALTHQATVVSFDNGFARFPGVRWELPPQH